MKPEKNACGETIEILIVEDSPTQAEQLKYILEQHGYKVSAANNGKQALALLDKHKPTLVISDIVMPEMDGYELCRQIKSKATADDVPVILLTSLSDAEDVLEGLACGADNFITKPYNEEYLLSSIEQILANKKLRKGERVRIGVEIVFAGKKRFITAEQQQMLTLLISTYEAAIQKNKELAKTQEELRLLNEHLEDLVKERTAALTNEITERKREEEALRQSDARFRILFEQAADIILQLEITPEGMPVIREANSATFRLLGYERDELIGQPVSFIDAALDASKVVGERRENVLSGPGTVFEARHRCKDGTVRDFECSGTEMQVGSKTFAISVERDITDRKRVEAEREKLEEQLRVSQKMEAIGSLAGGIAHDFNNLLSVILNYTDFAMEGMREGDPVRDDLLKVKKAGERAAALTHQLLAFSRKQVLQPVPLNLNQIAAGVEKMLRRILGEDIDFVQVLAPDLGLTLVDPGQIEQVLMNLVVNARDAMHEGGKLTIETSNTEIDEEYVACHMAVKPGSYVQLTVTDTGCGMDEQTKARLFEPFFTTKEKGKGTGLGLSTVYGIVKQSGGNISVYSEPGQGTTFKIYLPRDLSATTVTAIKPPTVLRRSTGAETILVVEDEEELRKVARRILDAAGCTVLTAADGDEALLISARHAGDIHLLLTDVVMPRMSGRVLAQELSKTRPALKVLYMSGYADNAIVHHGVLDAGTHFLGKPFTADDLTRKVREVLDGGITDLADGHEQAVKPEAGMTEQPLDRDALRALPQDVLGKLRKAVIAARYDEIVEIVESMRLTQPAMASGLRQLVDGFEYDRILELLGR